MTLSPTPVGLTAEELDDTAIYEALRVIMADGITDTLDKWRAFSLFDRSDFVQYQCKIEPDVIRRIASLARSRKSCLGVDQPSVSSVRLPTDPEFFSAYGRSRMHCEIAIAENAFMAVVNAADLSRLLNFIADLTERRQ